VSAPGAHPFDRPLSSNVTVGRNPGSAGTITVEAGAMLNVDTMSIGRGGSGTLNVLGGGTTVNLVGDAEGTFGGGILGRLPRHRET
jgi:T5SS/PEP-CTERM-associated repeat protein